MYSLPFETGEREKFAKNLKERREKLGMTWAELAKASESSYKTIYNIEDRQNMPSLSLYVRLCRALKMKPPPFWE